jgi:hypothetical protein
LLPVSLTAVANLPPLSTTLAKLVAKFAAGVIDTGGKNAAGVVDTAAILQPVSLIREAIHRCRWYQWSTWTCKYLREFLKKFKTVLMEGKLIHEKNQKQKISWHCILKISSVGTGQILSWFPMWVLFYFVCDLILWNNY